MKNKLVALKRTVVAFCLVGATTLIAAQAASPPIQWNAIVRRDAPPSVFVDLVHAVHRNQAKQACHRAATIFAKASALPPGTRPVYAFSVMGEGLRIAEPASLFGKDACLIQLQPPALSLEGPPIPMS